MKFLKELTFTKKLIIFEVLFFILLLVADLVTKAIVDANMTLGQSIVAIEGVLNFTYVHNTGAAFSMFEGKMLYFYIITPISFAIFTWYLVKNHKDSILQNISVVMILAGMLGNFYDRVVYQYVRDMIHATFIDFPIWNVADMWLVIGVGLLVIYLIMEIVKELKMNKKDKDVKQD